MTGVDAEGLKTAKSGRWETCSKAARQGATAANCSRSASSSKASTSVRAIPILTWQEIAGINYAFSWREVIAAWRHLDYDSKSGQKLESLNLNGPAIGVAFRW